MRAYEPRGRLAATPSNIVDKSGLSLHELIHCFIHSFVISPSFKKLHIQATKPTNSYESSATTMAVLNNDRTATGSDDLNFRQILDKGGRDQGKLT